MRKGRKDGEPGGTPLTEAWSWIQRLIIFTGSALILPVLGGIVFGDEVAGLIAHLGREVSVHQGEQAVGVAILGAELIVLAAMYFWGDQKSG